jgi:hypothetical protein
MPDPTIARCWIADTADENGDCLARPSRGRRVPARRGCASRDASSGSGNLGGAASAAQLGILTEHGGL